MCRLCMCQEASDAGTLFAVASLLLILLGLCIVAELHLAMDATESLRIDDRLMWGEVSPKGGVGRETAPRLTVEFRD